MSIPASQGGMVNYYQAHLDAAGGVAGSLSVLAVPIDDLLGGTPVALIKIDVEGHETAALAGLQRTIRAHQPTLIVETGDQTVVASLLAQGYAAERLSGSPNVLFRPHE
jgi:FkbM family methyltransferase